MASIGLAASDPMGLWEFASHIRGITVIGTRVRLVAPTVPTERGASDRMGLRSFAGHIDPTTEARRARGPAGMGDRLAYHRSDDDWRRDDVRDVASIVEHSWAGLDEPARSRRDRPSRGIAYPALSCSDLPDGFQVSIGGFDCIREISPSSGTC
jgi:hypothetical protein